MKTASLLTLLSLTALSGLQAEVRLSSLFTDHMVLQREMKAPVWGWDKPGTQVTVSFAGQTKKAKADKEGRWEVKLDPLKASSEGRPLRVKGSSTATVKDVLVGEVWVCSGQSNMRWTVTSTWDSDLEIANADHPKLRLLHMPNVGTQEPQDDFEGEWQVCTPETVPGFSAVGYFYGRLLHELLDVPVGLINNAWGGSAAEAWIKREVLDNDPRYAELMESWQKKEATYDFEALKANHEKAMAAWKVKAAEARKAGNAVPRPPRAPRDIMTGQHRPGNLYAGCLHPIIGFAIRGAIWYQGESNSGLAKQYRDLFPRMINHWREEWGQGDFSFYWVQLADYMPEVEEPEDSAWAELREAQTMTLKLPNTGQAVIIDLGEASDIHPRNKRDVAERLARWALVKDYGMDFAYRSPEMKDARFKGGKALISFDHVGAGLRTVDASEVQGFAICGADQKWVNAEARLIHGANGVSEIEVSHPEVKKPVAVRYAWANNPICNVISSDGLPLTPFRTDDFPMVTEGAEAR